MGMLTIRMPDATHERLRQLARTRKVSVIARARKPR